MSTLFSICVDTCLLDLNICSVFRCRHFSPWCVDTSFPNSKPIFRCRHLKTMCQHFSPKCISLNFLIFWTPITSSSSRCLPHRCVCSSLSSIHWDSWLIWDFHQIYQYSFKSSGVDTLWTSVYNFWAESILQFSLINLSSVTLWLWTAR